MLQVHVIDLFKAHPRNSMPIVIENRFLQRSIGLSHETNWPGAEYTRRDAKQLFK